MTANPQVLTNRINELAPPFLKGLPADVLDVVLGASANRRMRAGTHFVHEGRYSDKLYLLLEGEARLFGLATDGDKIHVTGIQAGTIVGATALITEAVPYTIGAEMVTDGDLLVWEREALRTLAYRFPRLLDNVLGIFADYTVYHRRMVIATAHESLEERVVKCLDWLVRKYGKATPTGVELRLSNEELAQAVSTSEYNVSRVLAAWRRGGLIEKGRGRISIPSIEALRRAK